MGQSFWSGHLCCLHKPHNPGPGYWRAENQWIEEKQTVEFILWSSTANHLRHLHCLLSVSVCVCVCMLACLPACDYKHFHKIIILSVLISEVVPKPAITSSCNPDKTSCTLTCEGNTTDAEPVTYRWKLGEGAWEVSGQQKIVSRNDNTNISYTCQLKNPVSEASEDFDKDLFGPDGWLTKARLFGISVFVLAVAGVLLFILGHRAKTGVCFYEKESMPWEGGVSFSAVNTPAAEEGQEGMMPSIFHFHV
uniref:Ig-like domain-containing protein n=1 Tax=Hucho hucho TaxID=62062 RepID=A0A4W5PND5_9TELE